MKCHGPVVALLCLAHVSPVCADEVQNWTMLLMHGPVKDNIITWTEVQPRFRIDEGPRMSQMLLRQGFGLRLKDGTEVILGYHWQENRSNPARIRQEHRIWQHVSVPFNLNDKGLRLTTQFRLEQRMFVNEPDTIWRARGQARLDIPLNGPGTFGPMIASETMFNLNGGNTSTRGGFEQQRTSVGLSAPFGKAYVFDMFYMNQRLSRIGPDQVIHVIGIKLGYKLGKKGKAATSLGLAAPQS
jgi:hypothetical protein